MVGQIMTFKNFEPSFIKLLRTKIKKKYIAFEYFCFVLKIIVTYINIHIYSSI